MKSYRWLTLSAALGVTVLEAWLFTAASASASQIDSLSTDNAADSGQALYSTYCGACHQANGEGMAGVFPPLKGSGVVNRADATKHIDIVLGGLQGARASGVTYSNAMPGFAAALSDEEIAAIIDYERGAWGNHGNLVGPAQVASERARLN
jgi:mono/diheme cytochrome c family protein